MTTFTTISAAQAAGFTLGSTRRFETYRGCHIAGCDISGRSGGLQNFGYSFALRAEVPADVNGCEYGVTDFSPNFGHTETITLTETLNKMRQPGCYVAAFSPAALATAKREARAWIDAWFDAHPEAVTRVAENERANAERAARRDAKRHTRLAAKGLI